MLPLAANHRTEGWHPAVTPQWESTMSTWNNDGNVSSCLFQISMWGISSSLHTDWCLDKVERQTLRIPRANIYCDINTFCEGSYLSKCFLSALKDTCMNFNSSVKANRQPAVRCEHEATIQIPQTMTAAPFLKVSCELLVCHSDQLMQYQWMNLTCVRLSACSTDTGSEGVSVHHRSFLQHGTRP